MKTRKLPHRFARVMLALSLVEAEALTLFIADRPELWNIHAKGCGVEDPIELPRKLADGYAAAFKGGTKA